MERCHLTPKRSSRPRRPRARVCLRKGCGRRYQPRRWNQRYCQDTECLRQLRRWQAAQRQARRRQDDAVKAEHAAAERVRRQGARRQRAGVSAQASDKPKVGAARGHAAKIFAHPLCTRPGCYEAAPKLGRNQAHYCGPDCGQAVRRVLDRERKWVRRGTFQGRRQRAREYQAARARRSGQKAQQADRAGTPPRAPPWP